MPDVRLTEWTTCGGCAAKWGAAPLRAMVASLARERPDVLGGRRPTTTPPWCA
ncbi:MAG: hypothetical protein KY443_05830 [Actinobacteria bacterium]|nr:hypothetical protein [Actinomycetota bacterium]